MIRVAWMVPNTPNWIGGLNYFRNLLEALLSLPERRIEPVVVGNVATLPAPFDRCNSVPYPSLRRFSPAWVRDRVGMRFLDNGGRFAEELLRCNVRLLSHSQWLGRRSPVPAMCWIPDFQQRHLPHLFSEEEIKIRNASQDAAARLGQAVVLSSEDARRDFVRHHSTYAGKARVLHFVAHAPTLESLPSAEKILAHHGINEPFFHIPNQLWVHKNHKLIARALSILADRRGCAPLVVSTGQTDDYRNPEHFLRLVDVLCQTGLTDRFRFLGLLPYAEMAVLMRQSVALVNPSLFEGWSTTVEEAKSLGKRLLLSDIPVHREQAPVRGTYFDPADPEALADQMAETLDSFDPAVERDAAARADDERPARMRSYARDYEEIALDVINLHAQGRGH